MGEAENVAARAAQKTERRAEGEAELAGGERGGARAGGDDAAGAEQERVREAGKDFLDVVRDEDECGRVFAAREFFQEAQKILAGDGIEAGAGLIEDEQARPGHEGAGDKDALAFALRKELPLAVEQMRGAEEAEEFFGGGDVTAGRRKPEIELGVTTADDGFDGGLGGGDAGLEGAGHDADFETEVAPVGLAVALAEEADVAGAGGKVAEERFEERGLAAAVGAEDGPVFAALHAPVEAVKNDGVAAGDAQAGDIEDRRHVRAA